MCKKSPFFVLQPPGFDEVGAFAPDESYQQGREMYQAPGSQQNMSGSQHDMSRGGYLVLL